MRKLLTRGSRLVVLVALLLSGCFRPSGDTIEPTSPGTTADTIQQPAGNATATPEAPPITLLSPDVTAAPTLDLATQSGPVITEVTVIPFEATSTATALAGSVTPTLQFITPGISLGLVTPETATAAPPPTMSAEELLTQSAALPGEETGDDTGSGDTSSNVSSTDVELVSGAECTYTVEPGDNLYRISILNDTTVNAMMDANPTLVGDPPVLQPGQVLALPDCTPGGGGTSGSSGTNATAEPTLSNDSTAIPAEQETYRVQPGDTLMAIANRYRTSVNALMQANNLADPNILSIGQTLIIPRNNSEDDS